MITLVFLINVLDGINVLVLNSKVYQHTFLLVLPNRGLPKVVFLAEAEGRKNFGLRPKTEAEGFTLGDFNGF